MAEEPRGLKRQGSITGGVVRSGQPSAGMHASGFPIYQNLPSTMQELQEAQESVAQVGAAAEDVGFSSDEDSDFDDSAPLEMPSSMQYSEDGTYEHLPTPIDPDMMPTGMEYSQDGIYESFPAMKGEAGYAVGQTEAKSVARSAKQYFEEPVVHESEVRRSFVQGRVLEDEDRSKKCTGCKTCPGFDEHYWRKVCKWCRCPRVQHFGQKAAATLNLDTSVVTQMEGLSLLKKKYAWAPVGAPQDLVEAYFQAIPKACVPAIGTPGEQWRKKQLIAQCPPYDTNWESCDQLTAKEIEWFKKFDQLRLREAFDIGEVIRCPDMSRPPECRECFLKEDGTHWPYCSKYIEPQAEQADRSSVASDTFQQQGLSPAFEMPDIKMMKKRSRSPRLQKKEEPAVAAPKKSGASCRGCCTPLMVDEVVVQIDRLDDEDNLFHPACVMCSQCGELLVDLRVYVDVGWEERGQSGAEPRLFCARHWSDNRRPRCIGCDETIHQAKHVFELNHPWHFRHFACYICDVSLVESEKYVPRDGNPLCVDCYKEHIADKCVACHKAINPSKSGGGKISLHDKHWHPACFNCKHCKKPLQGKPCVPKGNRVYCKKCFKKLVRKDKA
eukprot:m.25442 g.25442  ORF g.25442 m.25442 type:complete len:610 (+) comp8714_c0_seq2:44-1873(+)